MNRNVKCLSASNFDIGHSFFMIDKIHIWDYELLCHLIVIQPIPIVKYIFNCLLKYRKFVHSSAF